MEKDELKANETFIDMPNLPEGCFICDVKDECQTVTEWASVECWSNREKFYSKRKNEEK